MTVILLDTNIYLNFYRSSSYSLVMIDELLKLIKTEKIKLILPKQIENEFYCNKYTISNEIAENIKNLQNAKFNIPHFLQSYKSVRSLKKILKNFKKIRENIIKECNNRISNSKSEINQKIKKLFKNANTPIEKGEIIQKAHYRTLRGYPPRKNNNSFGDAIIWETILDEVRDEDLIIISNDGDFAEHNDKDKLNSFLEHEWLLKNKKSLKLHTELGKFINDFTKEPIIKKNIIEEEKSLRGSPRSSMGFYGGFLAPPNQNILDNTINIGIGPFVRHCSNCQKEFTPSITAVYGDRCEDCQGSISFIGATSICSMCGNIFQTDPGIIMLKPICPNCQKKY